MAGFQKTVNQQPAPGVEGSFASYNPRATYVTGPASLVANPGGVICGRFGWALPTANADGTVTEIVYNTSVGVANGLPRTPGGFIGNEQQGLFTGYLQESGFSILAGQGMEMFTRGDFWALMVGAAATRGQKAFANLTDGTIRPAAAGSTISAATVTASFATNVMTVTATTGVLTPGQAVTSAVTTLPANTFILAQLTGTTGGNGTYSLTTTPGTIASQANTASNFVETRFFILSAALAGEIAKIGFGD